MAMYSRDSHPYPETISTIDDHQHPRDDMYTTEDPQSFPMVRENGRCFTTYNPPFPWEMGSPYEERFVTEWPEQAISAKFSQGLSSRDCTVGNLPSPSTPVHYDSSQDNASLGPNLNYQEPLSPSYSPDISQAAGNSSSNNKHDYLSPGYKKQYFEMADGTGTSHLNLWSPESNSHHSSSTHGLQSVAMPPIDGGIPFSEPRLMPSFHTRSTVRASLIDGQNSAAEAAYSEYPSLRSPSLGMPEASDIYHSSALQKDIGPAKRMTRQGSRYAGYFAGYNGNSAMDPGDGESQSHALPTVTTTDLTVDNTASQEAPSAQRGRKRKRREISPDGRDHCNAVRKSGGACKRCRRKKIRVRILSTGRYILKYGCTDLQSVHTMKRPKL